MRLERLADLVPDRGELDATAQTVFTTLARAGGAEDHRMFRGGVGRMAAGAQQGFPQRPVTPAIQAFVANYAGSGL